MITMKFAQVLNYYRRNILGAKGTTSWRMDADEMAALTPTEREDVYLLESRSLRIHELLDKQDKAITDFYEKHGSDRTKRNIAARKIIGAKIKNCEDITDEEFDIWSGKKDAKKTNRKSPTKLSTKNLPRDIFAVKQ